MTGNTPAPNKTGPNGVLPAGQHPDACYWFDTDTGMFVTSTYYRQRLHPWVADFNRRRPADAWFGRTWRKLSGIDYQAFSGPDEMPGEGKGIGQGVSFPHPLNAGLREPGPNYYLALFNSPFGNDLLLDLALRAKWTVKGSVLTILALGLSFRFRRGR